MRYYFQFKPLDKEALNRHIQQGSPELVRGYLNGNREVAILFQHGKDSYFVPDESALKADYIWCCHPENLLVRKEKHLLPSWKGEVVTEICDGEVSLIADTRL